MSGTTAELLLAGAIIACMALTTPSLHANEYFLSPEGDDADAGTRNNPWQSIEHANETLEPGDTAVFLPGEYSGTISPHRNGNADAPITYRSSEPWAARLVAEDVSLLIDLNEHEHVVIEGFELDGLHSGGWLAVIDCEHITIRGNSMRDARPSHHIARSSQIRLIDNVFDKGTTRGDTFHVRECSQVLVEGNSHTRVGHNPFRIVKCVGVVVRANVFRCEWGRNYSFMSSGQLLIENNIITRARDAAWSADPIAKNLYEDSIFRHNLVFGNLGQPLNTSSYIWRGIAPTDEWYRSPFVTVNSRFYHNTITDNLGIAWSLGGVNISSNVFQNNIFYRNDYAGAGTQVRHLANTSGDNRFVTNLMRGAEPGQPVVRYGDNWWTAEEANENTRTVGGFWSEFHENIDADPAFVDAENRDYRLSAASEAIDAGTPLALAMGEGTGSELPVTDGRWFYDGFGIEGEEGDHIAIGSGDNIAQIERVELRYYQPAILHLDREVTWEDGWPVSLPWTGEAPDLGAIQRDADHPTAMAARVEPAEVEPGDPVTFSLDTFGKEVASVTWDFEDGTYSNELEPTHAYDRHGHYGVTVRATFADGQRGVAPVFVHVPQRLDPQAPMVEVDFEEETRGDTWGYYFKFYRGHQTGYAHVDRPDGDGMCMHLFYDEDKRNSTAGQIAPGAWDIDRYPIVRFDYRIPEGVPVAIEVTPFAAPERPGGFILGGTESRPTRGEVLDVYPLIDDGQWHTITIDVRDAREAYPELEHLRQFMFYTDWREDEGQEFWFDNFSIMPEE